MTRDEIALSGKHGSAAEMALANTPPAHTSTP